MAKAPTRKPPAKKQARKAQKKPASRKPAAGSRAVPQNVDRQEESLSIRKIKNGYVVRRSWMEGKGPNAKFREEESFTPKKPRIMV